jgi:hypothetical protein
VQPRHPSKELTFSARRCAASLVAHCHSIHATRLSDICSVLSCGLTDGLAAQQKLRRPLCALSRRALRDRKPEGSLPLRMPLIRAASARHGPPQ